MSTKEEIQSIIDRGESVQFVGLTGMGKSHTLREFSTIFIDASLLYPADYTTLLKNFAQSFDIKTKSENSIEIQKLISEKIKVDKITIIIDGLEKIIKPEFTQFFSFLKRLRDIHKPNLNFIFSVSSLKPIGFEQNIILGDFYPIVQENVIYAKPIPKDIFRQSVKNDFPNYITNETDYDKLYSLTGGIVSLVKAKLKDNQLLLDSQVFEIKNQIQNVSLEDLQKHGLLNENGQIISELLQTNIVSSLNKLTVLESLLFNILLENINTVVSKDSICESVYPEVKNKNGISDSSIDQLVHRLKKKLIDSKYSIENKHGFGYKLLNN